MRNLYNAKSRAVTRLLYSITKVAFATLLCIYNINMRIIYMRLTLEITSVLPMLQ